MKLLCKVLMQLNGDGVFIYDLRNSKMLTYFLKIKV